MLGKRSTHQQAVHRPTKRQFPSIGYPRGPAVVIGVTRKPQAAFPFAHERCQFGLCLELNFEREHG